MFILYCMLFVGIVCFIVGITITKEAGIGFGFIAFGLLFIIFSSCGLTAEIIKCNALNMLASDNKVILVIDEDNNVDYELKDSTMVNTFNYLKEEL